MSTYTDSVESHLEGLEAVSTGICPGCETCREEYAPEMSMTDFHKEWSNGYIVDEPHFSWRGCGICGSHLGGDREVWHWVDKDGAIIHESGACVDCIVYLANSDEPETWEG